MKKAIMTIINRKWDQDWVQCKGVVDGHTNVAPAGEPKNSTIFNATVVNLDQ